MWQLILLIIVLTVTLPAFAAESDWKALEERRCHSQEEAAQLFKEYEKSDWELFFSTPEKISATNWKQKPWKPREYTRKQLEKILKQEKNKNFLVAEYKGSGYGQAEDMKSFLSKFGYKRLLIIKGYGIGWPEVLYDSLNHDSNKPKKNDALTKRLLERIQKSESITLCEYKGTQIGSSILRFHVVEFLKGGYNSGSLPVRSTTKADGSSLWIVFIKEFVPVDGALETIEPGGMIEGSRENLEVVVDEINKLGGKHRKFDEVARKRIFGHLGNDYAIDQKIPFRKKDIQSYLEKRWTADRIKKFCRSDTRHLGAPTLCHGKGSIGGELHAGSVWTCGKYCVSGKIEWRACDYGDGKKLFEVDVKKGPYFWVLEQGELRYKEFSNNEFKKYLAFKKLEQAFHAKQLANSSLPIAEDEQKHSSIMEPKDLTQNADETMMFHGTTWDRKEVTAKVDNFEILEVLIDGSQSEYWSDAVKDACKNINKRLDYLMGPPSTSKKYESDSICVAQFRKRIETHPDVLEFRWLVKIKGSNYPHGVLAVESMSLPDKISLEKNSLWIIYIEMPFQSMATISSHSNQAE